MRLGNVTLPGVVGYRAVAVGCPTACSRRRIDLCSDGSKHKGALSTGTVDEPDISLGLIIYVVLWLGSLLDRPGSLKSMHSLHLS